MWLCDYDNLFNKTFNSKKKKYIFQRFMSELQLNKKIGLSEKGKEKAKFKLFNPEYRNVDCIYLLNI